MDLWFSYSFQVLQNVVMNFFCQIPRCGIAGLCGKFMFNFKKKLLSCFSKQLWFHLTFPLAVYENSSLFISLPTFVIFYVFDYRCSVTVYIQHYISLISLKHVLMLPTVMPLPQEYPASHNASVCRLKDSGPCFTWEILKSHSHSRFWDID